MKNLLRTVMLAGLLAVRSGWTEQSSKNPSPTDPAVRPTRSAREAMAGWRTYMNTGGKLLSGFLVQDTSGASPQPGNMRRGKVPKNLTHLHQVLALKESRKIIRVGAICN
jgi:hypothetical protein